MLVKRTMPRWVWWKKGECVVEVIRTGHFPTSIIGKLPTGKETEIDIDELDVHSDGVELENET